MSACDPCLCAIRTSLAICSFAPATHVEDRVLAILGSLNDARANPQELPDHHMHDGAGRGVHRGPAAPI